MTEAVQTENTQVKKQTLSSQKKKRAIFYALMVTPLLVQFAIFYFYVNIETFVLAFQEYTQSAPGEPYVVQFAGFKNFIGALNWLIESPHYYLNAFKFYFFQLVIGMSLSLLFSFYMYKKLPLAGTFKYFLYLPHILSGVLVVILYRFLLDDVVIAIQKTWYGIDGVGLLDDGRPTSLRFALIIVYNIYISLGTNMLVYVSTMESVDPSLVESAQLDGANILQEFWLITLPMIWTTFMTFFITTITGIFTTNLSLYTFYGAGCNDDIAVIGYELYVMSLQSTMIGSVNSSKVLLTYPELSAVSLIVTLVLTPIVLGIRKAFIKWGPSAS